jgi:hypothetical protein
VFGFPISTRLYQTLVDPSISFQIPRDPTRPCQSPSDTILPYRTPPDPTRPDLTLSTSGPDWTLPDLTAPVRAYHIVPDPSRPHQTPPDPTRPVPYRFPEPRKSWFLGTIGTSKGIMVSWYNRNVESSHFESSSSKYFRPKIRFWAKLKTSKTYILAIRIENPGWLPGGIPVGSLVGSGGSGSCPSRIGVGSEVGAPDSTGIRLGFDLDPRGDPPGPPGTPQDPQVAF